MTQSYDWYGDWRSTQISCPSCGWTGALEEKGVETYSELADFRCPGCNEILAIINFPTRADIEKNWDKLTAEQKRLYSGAFDQQDEFDKTCLVSPAQLPDIDAESIILVWDFEEKPASKDGHPEKYVVIKHEGQSIWQELAFYQCVDRFDEVVTILQQKYGNRLKDLIPSEASTSYLGGDDLSAWDKLAKIRARLEPADVDASARLLALARAGDQRSINTFRFEREYAAHHLESTSPLTDIKGRRIVLAWDIAEDPPRVEARRTESGVYCDWAEGQGDRFLYLTICHGSTVIWREAASDSSRDGEDGEQHFDFVDRYVEVVAILRGKYGERLRDLQPTDRSQAYVGGMPWYAIKKERARLFASKAATRR